MGTAVLFRGDVLPPGILPISSTMSSQSQCTTSGNNRTAGCWYSFAFHLPHHTVLKHATPYHSMPHHTAVLLLLLATGSARVQQVSRCVPFSHR